MGFCKMILWASVTSIRLFPSVQHVEVLMLSALKSK
jgi:hypothetical protein